MWSPIIYELSFKRVNSSGFGPEFWTNPDTHYKYPETSWGAVMFSLILFGRSSVARGGETEWNGIFSMSSSSLSCAASSNFLLWLQQVKEIVACCCCWFKKPRSNRVKTSCLVRSVVSNYPTCIISSCALQTISTIYPTIFVHVIKSILHGP